VTGIRMRNSVEPCRRTGIFGIPDKGEGKETLMKKGDLTTKAIGLAIAGILAGSRLATAVQDSAAKPADKKPVSTGEEKAKDKAAPSDKNACKGMNACKGKGGCKSGDGGCAGKNSCKGKGGCASADVKHSCKGMNACKGQGGCKSGDAGCAGKNSCKGKGGCAVPVKKAA
jgi:hypothetical protein